MLERESKTGRNLCNSAIFNALVLFCWNGNAKRGKQKEGKVPGGAGLSHAVMCMATFLKRKVYFFISIFELCQLVIDS
jgi:hypothetical protein